jgi:glycogen synthase
VSLPLHILMTADTVGGVWTYAIELAHTLTQHGVRVSLATMGARMSAEQRRQARLPGVDVHESDFKLEWMDNPWEDVDAAGDWLLGLERSLQPDLVHLNNYAHSNLGWSAPVVVVAHSCVYSWWNAVHGVPPPREWDEYRQRVANGLHAADAVVAVSRTMLRELEQWYGLFGTRVVVYNGHRPGSYSPGVKEDFVLSTGRVWDQAKNMAALDAAAGLIRWPVYVAGEAQHPEGGRRSMGHATPIGQLAPADLRQWFSCARVYALPALYEPFGLSVLEAALSGCALVLGDIPSLREIWCDAAVFVPPSDHEALAAAINLIIGRPDIGDDLGRRARARAIMFTTDRMAKGYLGVYPEARARYRAAKEAITACVS